MIRWLYLTLVCCAVAGCVKPPINQEQRVQMLERRSASQEQALKESETQITSLQETITQLEKKLQRMEKKSAQKEKALQQQLKAAKNETQTMDQQGSALDADSGRDEDLAMAAVPPAQVSQGDTGTELYSRALERLRKDGDIQGSQQLFQEFLLKNKGHKLVPNGLYWLGETYYVQKRYAQAILTFKEISKLYPQNSKAPDALLKIGFAYESLGDTDNMLFYLRTLIEEYPESPSASKARDRVSEIE